MIYEFAIEPELVATWHERRVGYPIWSQMGLGHSRVACAFPASTWRQLVIKALKVLFPNSGSVDWQNAKKNVEVLVRHLEEGGTARKGNQAHDETWIAAAQKEQGRFPFSGGVIVRAAPQTRSYFIEADHFGEKDVPAWNPPVTRIARQPKDLADALAPLLRAARKLRFVDPHFDAGVKEYFEPMREYLTAAQQRPDPSELSVEIHFSLRREDFEQAKSLSGRNMSERDVAQLKFDTCRAKLLSLLHPGGQIDAFAWAERVERPHNRYVLSNIGGVLVPHGLDSAKSAGQTDDLRVLSKEQHRARWAQFDRASTELRLIAAETIK